MRAYLDLLARVLQAGERRPDRTGVGTLGLFDQGVSVDLRGGFPLVTTKRVRFEASVAEFLWMVSGETNVAGLHERGARFWDKWADERGDLGPVYGAQWRDWGGEWSPGGRSRKVGVDQLSAVVEQIRRDPFSRRHLVSAWNVEQLPRMRLPPCHYAFQFWVDPRGEELSCLVSMRSLDVFIGLPFDLSLYALLLSCVAVLTGKRPAVLSVRACDAHLYLSHVEQAQEQLGREPRGLPRLGVRWPQDLPIEALRVEDFELRGYDPWPAIRAEVAV